MSQENVELTRRGYEAYNSGGLEAIIDFLDPEIEWTEGADVPEVKTYHGHDGVREQQARFASAWEEFGLEPEDLVDAGDQIVAMIRAWGRGKGSGVIVEARVAHVWTIRDGKAVRFEVFMDRHKALEAVGLRE